MRMKLLGIGIATALALALCLTCFLLVTHVTDQVEALSTQALGLVDQGRTEEAAHVMTRLVGEWSRYAPVLELIISHEEMNTVVERYLKAQSSLRHNQLDDFHKEMTLLREILRHVREQESIGWGNLF